MLNWSSIALASNVDQLISRLAGTFKNSNDIALWRAKYLRE
jgi:hypothetical protein